MRNPEPYITARPIINYGFSEKKFRASLSTRYYKHGFHRTAFDFAGGVQIKQFNSNDAVSKFYNTTASLFDKVNYIKTVR